MVEEEEEEEEEKEEEKMHSEAGQSLRSPGSEREIYTSLHFYKRVCLSVFQSVRP